MPNATATDHAGLLATLMGALERVVHDDRVPNEVSQELAEVLILARREMAEEEPYEFGGSHCTAHVDYAPESRIPAPAEPPPVGASEDQQLHLARALANASTHNAAPPGKSAYGCNRCGQTQQTWTAQCVHCNPVPQPQLAVWYGSLPESNGKTNWTAMLHRAGEHFSEGITVERSEYPDRVRYEADRFRHLIGELKDEPCVLDYDTDLHSGYAGPQR